MKIQVCDISGMGGREFGGYEWGCQVLCARALRFLKSLPVESALPRHVEYKQIVGIASPKGEVAERMDKFMLDHPVLEEKGVTGAMHQYALSHAWKIFELGREKYLEKCRETRNQEDFYDFEEDDAFPVKAA